MLLLLAEMKGQERHSEQYFCIIKYCLHYFCIKSCLCVLSNPYSFCKASDQDQAKSFTNCTNDFSENAATPQSLHSQLFSCCGDAWQVFNDTANTLGQEVKRTTLIYNSKRCIKNDNMACISSFLSNFTRYDMEYLIFLV